MLLRLRFCPSQCQVLGREQSKCCGRIRVARCRCQSIENVSLFAVVVRINHKYTPDVPKVQNCSHAESFRVICSTRNGSHSIRPSAPMASLQAAADGAARMSPRCNEKAPAAISQPGPARLEACGGA
jgi:hypothetical protein